MSKRLILIVGGFFLLTIFAGWKKVVSIGENPVPTTIIGVEYTFPGQSQALARTGIKGVKYFPDIYEWGDMQKQSGGAIDFTETDRYVKEYEDAGFTNLTMALQSRSNWASVDAKGLKPKNFSPKPEFEEQWKKYVSAVVERYDMDGKDDMPGLRVPVKYYEIGTEFSTYVPESAEDYIRTLTLAYKAAHDAFPDVKILHAAFLTTTAITARSTPDTYEKDFADVKNKYGNRILWHSLEDDRKILDHPEIFDVVNFHSCGDVYEIEGIVKWLKWEMNKRGYSKLLYISDTTPTPFIAWGNSVDCNLKPEQMGIIVSPFEETDRCRISALMKKVVDGDSTSIKWLYGFLASDLVKKCVVASDMHVIEINTSFSEDLALLKMKILKGGAGTSAWAGMLSTKADAKTNVRTVTGYRPMYYALRQAHNLLDNIKSIERVGTDDPGVRLYKVISGKLENMQSYVAWYEPGKIPLPGDPIPTKKIKLNNLDPEGMVFSCAQTSVANQPTKLISAFPSDKDGSEFTLTNVPLFITW